MKMNACKIIILFVTVLLVAANLYADKIESLVSILGAESIHVSGYGIVTGLKQTGDKSSEARKALIDYLDKNNLSVKDEDLASNSVALVIIDAQVPAFMRAGQKISVRVTVCGDATSLDGGVLQSSPLETLGKDTVAIASGRMSVSKNHPTTGIIPANENGGAQLTRTMAVDVISDDNKFYLNLKKNNWKNAYRIAARINDEDSLNPSNVQQRGFGRQQQSRKIAWAKDPVQIVVEIPESKLDQKVEFIAQVLDLEVAVDRPARILINKQHNSVIISGDVRVAREVVVSHNGLTVTVSPPATAPADSPSREYTLQDATARSLIELDGHAQSTNLRKFIDTLNAMGAKPEDIIVILQNLIKEGAINAELTVE